MAKDNAFWGLRKGQVRLAKDKPLWAELPTGKQAQEQVQTAGKVSGERGLFILGTEFGKLLQENTMRTAQWGSTSVGTGP